MKRSVSFCAILVLLVAGNTTVAEEISLTLESYQNLLDRVQQLEQQDQDQPPIGFEQPVRLYPFTPRPGGWYFQSEAVFVKPHFSSNVAFSVQPGLDVESFDFPWEMHGSPRFEFGYAPQSEGLGWRARWWHFQHNTETRANSVNDSILIQFTNMVSTDDTGNATIFAQQGIKLKVWDVEFLSRHELWNTSLVGGTGIRYARMDQRGAWDELGTNQFVRVTNDFEGIGPTLFLESRRSIFEPWLGDGVQVFANARGSLLYGDKDYVGYDDQGRRFDVNRNNDLLPVGEIQIGFELHQDTEWARFFLRMAWESQIWLGAGSTGAAEAAATDPSTTGQRADLGFHGFFIGGGIR